MISRKVQLLTTGVLLLANVCVAEPAPPVLWTRPLDRFCSSTAAVAEDGTIFIGTGSGKLLAIDENGITKWTYRTHSEIVSSPAIAADGTIYIGGRDRALHAVTPCGKRKWRFETGAWVDSSPAIETDGTIYFGSWDKKFYALKPDGSKKWEFSTGGEIVSSPAIAVDGTIYFGSHDKKFYALNPDGSKKWEFTTGGQIISSPAIAADGMIVFSSVDGWLYALNPDGSKKWELWTGGVTSASPAIDATGEIRVAANQKLISISSQGASNSVFYADTDLAGTPALFENGDAIIGDPYGNLYSLKPDGSCRWRDRLGYIFYASPVMDAKGNIIMADNGDHLFAFKNGIPPAPAPWPMFRHDLRHTGKATR